MPLVGRVLVMHHAVICKKMYAVARAFAEMMSPLFFFPADMLSAKISHLI